MKRNLSLRGVRRFLLSHSFLTIAMLVPLLIMLLAVLEVEVLYGAMRIAVIPLYLSLSLIHALYIELFPGAQGKPPIVSFLVGIALYLAPFVLLDVIRARTLKSR